MAVTTRAIASGMSAQVGATGLRGDAAGDGIVAAAPAADLVVGEGGPDGAGVDARFGAGGETEVRGGGVVIVGATVLLGPGRSGGGVTGTSAGPRSCRGDALSPADEQRSTWARPTAAVRLFMR
jgi:hypothetical protein